MLTTQTSTMATTQRAAMVAPFGQAQMPLTWASSPWDLMAPFPANLTTELTLLAMLCDVDVASAETVRLAGGWCEHNGARSLEYVMGDAAMAEDFVRALDLKMIPARRLLAVLQAGTCEVITAMRALHKAQVASRSAGGGGADTQHGATSTALESSSSTPLQLDYNLSA